MKENEMDDIAQFRALYDAFNRRDIDAVLARMNDEVDWPNAWRGGRLTGREAIREYWTAQWAEIDPHVEALSVTRRPDGSLAVRVRQVVRSIGGELLGDGEVVHVYRMRDERIDRMDVEEP
jgi:hypothetical protein